MARAVERSMRLLLILILLAGSAWCQTTSDTVSVVPCPPNNLEFVQKALLAGFTRFGDSLGRLPEEVLIFPTSEPALATPILEAATSFAKTRGCLRPVWPSPGDSLRSARLIIRVKRMTFDYPERVGGGLFGGGSIRRHVTGELDLMLSTAGEVRGPVTVSIDADDLLPIFCREGAERGLPLFFTPPWEPKGFVEVLLEPLLVAGAVGGLLYLLYTSR